MPTAELQPFLCVSCAHESEPGTSESFKALAVNYWEWKELKNICTHTMYSASTRGQTHVSFCFTATARGIYTTVHNSAAWLTIMPLPQASIVLGYLPMQGTTPVHKE